MRNGTEMFRKTTIVLGLAFGLDILAWSAVGHAQVDSASPVPTPEQQERARRDLAAGQRLLKKGRFEAALSKLQAAYAVEPTAAALLGVAAAERETDRTPEAYRSYERLLAGPAEALSPEKTPQTASILVAHGRLLYSLGKFEESIAKDQLAIEADSQSRDAFYERAKGLEHQGKYQAAVSDGERALTLPELGTSDSQIHFLLGNVYLRLNKPDLAAAHLAKFHAAPQTTQR